jgi:5-methylcytosine-specific restriction endonuclease McrA
VGKIKMPYATKEKRIDHYWKNRDRFVVSLRESYQEHREKRLAEKKAQYESMKNDPVEKAKLKAYRESHKEIINAYQIEYRKTHKDSISAKKKKYHEANKKRRSEYMKGYYQGHKREAYIRLRNYQLRKRGAGGSHTLEEWLDLIEKYRHCCIYCGNRFEKLERDHIIPISKGGTDYITNIVPCCRVCNAKKGDRIIERSENHR